MQGQGHKQGRIRLDWAVWLGAFVALVSVALMALEHVGFWAQEALK